MSKKKPSNTPQQPIPVSGKAFTAIKAKFAAFDKAQKQHLELIQASHKALWETIRQHVPAAADESVQYNIDREYESTGIYFILPPGHRKGN